MLRVSMVTTFAMVKRRSVAQAIKAKTRAYHCRTHGSWTAWCVRGFRRGGSKLTSAFHPGAITPQSCAGWSGWYPFCGEGLQAMVGSWHQSAMPTFRQLAHLVVVNSSSPLSTQELARECGGKMAETLDGLRDLQAWGIVFGVRKGSGELCWVPRAEFASIAEVDAIPPWADRDVAG